MMAKTHQAAAVATVLIVAPHLSQMLAPSFPVPYTVVLVGASMLGALLPDGDTPYSKLGRRLFIFLFPYFLLQWFVKLLSIIHPPLKKVSKVLGHRGIAHDPLLWLAFSLPFFLFCFARKEEEGLFILAGLLIGVLSHLFLDYLSGGIPVYLFKNGRLKAPILIKTGSGWEMIIFLLFIVIDFICISKVF